MTVKKLIKLFALPVEGKNYDDEEIDIRWVTILQNN